MSLYDQDDNYSLNRLRNINGVAEGTSLPPRQVGLFRVPFVTNLKTAKTAKYFDQTQFIITWDEPILTNISHYAVYVADAQNPFASPTGPYFAPNSPIQINIPSPQQTRLIFSVQTVLKNGFISDFDFAPTCTGQTIP